MKVAILIDTDKSIFQDNKQIMLLILNRLQATIRSRGLVNHSLKEPSGDKVGTFEIITDEILNPMFKFVED